MSDDYLPKCERCRFYVNPFCVHPSVMEIARTDRTQAFSTTEAVDMRHVRNPCGLEGKLFEAANVKLRLSQTESD